MTWIAYILLIFSFGLFFVHLMYPCFLWLMGCMFRLKPTQGHSLAEYPVSVSMIIPVYAKDVHLLEKKMKNLSTLDFPDVSVEVIVAVDGDLPMVRAMIDQSFFKFPVFVTQTGAWVGKNAALNKAVSVATGEVLIFSDVDTELASDSVSSIVSHFTNKQVGGVCGTIQIIRQKRGVREFGAVQKIYWTYERWIKKLEMMFLQSVTSCSGQLVAIRKRLYPELPSDVNDDLFLALTVIQQEFKFTCAMDAIACISPPSKTISDELRRRPRIVSGGLTAIWKHRGLFYQKNTFTYGLCLFIHKVVRRLIPILLIIILAATSMLSASQPFWFAISVMQVIFYVTCIFAWRKQSPSRFFSTLAFLFTINIGMLIGIFEFLTAKGRSKW